MNELKRLAYLQALGTDTYVSQRQLPGAAPTRRLAVVRKSPAAGAQVAPQQGAATAPPRPPSSAPAVDPSGAAASPAPAAARTGKSPAAGSPRALAAEPDLSPRFSLAAIACGGWLWLEELQQSQLAGEQLQLLLAMAGALRLIPADAASQADARPVVTRFDWPIHTNRQLDLGPAAARAGAAGFIRRKLEQLDCRGLVLLGQGCEALVALDQIDCARLARTVSTAAMLQNPKLKRQAWQDLRQFFQQP